MFNSQLHRDSRPGSREESQSSSSSEDSEQQILLENERWWKALKEHDLTLVRALLKLHPDWLDVPNEAGYTPLHVVSHHHEDTELLDYLIDEGAEIDPLDAKGNTPLLLAARAGHLEVVQYLVESDVNLEAKDTNGNNAIHLAQRSRCPALVGYLYAQGLTFAGEGLHPAPPLLAAAASGDLDKVRDIFLMSGTNLHELNTDGDTALHLAARFGRNPALVAFLIEAGISVESTGYLKRTPIIAAAAGGDVETISLLKERFGANLTVTDEDGMIPFALAVFNGHKDAAEQLKAWGADVNQADNQGITPLYVAAESPRAIVRKMIGPLLSWGASVDKPDINSTTPLGAATQLGHVGAMRRLLQARADVNARDSDGITALRAAAYLGHTEAAALLLRRGADPQLTDNDGYSPLHAALKQNHQKMVKLLRRYLEANSVVQADAAEEKDHAPVVGEPSPHFVEMVLPQIGEPDDGTVMDNSAPEGQTASVPSPVVVAPLISQHGLFRAAVPQQQRGDVVEVQVEGKNCCVIL